jgi:hypothetical protein
MRGKVFVYTLLALPFVNFAAPTLPELFVHIFYRVICHLPFSHLPLGIY